jgi:predicted heme/steroid binding protein
LSRVRILSVFIALIALSAALAACGGSSGDDPQTVVEEATLKGIESGKINLAVDANVQGEKGGKVNVNLSGPFQSESEAEYPELDLAFSSKGSLGGKDLNREGGLTLLGNKAYVAYEGTEYEVDSSTFNYVKSILKQQSGGQGKSSEISACQEAASELELSDFVENLKSDGNAEVGGTSTTKVSGDLDATFAIEAVSTLTEDPTCSEQLSAAGPLPSAAELDKAKSTVQDSLKSAHVDLYVGDDHIVRRITAQATIEPPKSSKSGAKRVELDLDMTLTGVNEEQTISAPSNSKPLSDLFLKLGINPLELLGAFQNGGSEGLGSLLEGLSKAGGNTGGGGSGGGGGNSGGGGQQSYYQCLGEAHTPVDIQNCTGLLQ